MHFGRELSKQRCRGCADGRAEKLKAGAAGLITERFLKGRHREQLSDIELDVVESSYDAILQFKPRQEIVRHGARVNRSMMLIEGFVGRYMDGLDGERQLVALHVPGDFVDLHGFPMRRLDHDVEALTEVKMASYPHDTIQTMMMGHPNLGRMLWFSTLLDAAMHREWIFRLGRLDAVGRVAHLFAETGCRLQMVDIGDGRAFPLPFQQTDIAEACGMTAVHANRVLRKLREAEVVAFSAGLVRVGNLPELRRLAEFEEGYLYPSGR